MWVKTLLLSAAFAIGLGASACYAANVPAHGLQPVVTQAAAAARLIPVEQRMLSLRDAVEMVRSRYGGDLISVRQAPGGGQNFFILRWRFPNDSVEDIRVDAISGAISR
ncbi:MAG: hypothetical protein ABUL73_05515 [Alphaproteobacteria bacterium]